MIQHRIYQPTPARGCERWLFMENPWIIVYRELENEEDKLGVPVCGANLSSPVFDRSNFIEVHYKIGSKLYIENAD